VPNLVDSVVVWGPCIDSLSVSADPGLKPPSVLELEIDGDGDGLNYKRPSIWRLVQIHI
jgi:hypothetical protein